jgi:hypothetical protein
VASMEVFPMASSALQVLVPTMSPTLHEALPMASTVSSVPGPAEGEDPTTSTSRNLHLEVAAASEVAQLLEILLMAPQVLGLSENHVIG